MSPARALAPLFAVALVAAASGAAAQAPPPAQTAPRAPESVPPGPAAPAPAAAPPAYAPPAYAPPPYGYPPPGYPPYGYGAPPPYYYPPPGATYPYGFYPPQAFGPKTLEYVDGEPIPAGYHLKTRVRRGLAIAGAATFGGPFAFSAILGGAFLSEGGKESEQYGALAIPIAGPFVTIATARSEGAGTFLLVVDGIAQAGGVVMPIAGLAGEEKILVRNDVSAEKPSKIPAVAVGPTSARLAWRF